MSKKFTMLLASLFLVMGSAWAQVYQKVMHSEWTVTAPNQSGTTGNEGGVAFIKDENAATFYHSDWGSTYEGRSAKKGQDGLQGFMVDMGSVVYDLSKITYTGRSDNKISGWARKVRIYLYTELPEGIPADLSTLSYDAKEALFSKENETLGAAAFDNNENQWEDDQTLKTAEFSELKSARYVLFIMDSGHDNWLTCADFHVWQKVEGIVEDQPYFLKISGLEGDYYLDTRDGENSDYGKTISKTQTPVAAYFTLRDGYWHISSFPGHDKHFVGVTNWDARVGQDTPANWYLYKDAEHSLWSLAQSTYYGGQDAAKHYLGANNGDISGQSKLYTDKTIAQAVKFELVALDEKQTAAEAARLLLSHVGTGYPAVDSEARTTLQAAVDAADATVESINAAIAVYQSKEQTVLLPEVGKVYRFVSGLPGFNTKKAVYSDNFDLKWKDRDVAAMNQLWVVLSVSGNNIALMNVADAMSPQKSAFGAAVKMSAIKNECSFEFLGKGQFKIVANKEQGLHANSHGNGTGTSGNIINYNTGADGASAWYFEEVAVTQDILNKQIESIENTYINSLLIKHEGVVGLQTAVDDARSNSDNAAALVNVAKAVNAATIDYIEQGYFRMKSKSGQKYAYNDGTNLKTTTDNSSPKAVIKLTKATSGTFYIQNGNGYYAQGVSQSTIVNTAATPLKYVITRLASGYYVLRPENSAAVREFWHQDGSSNIVGWSADADNTQWTFEELTVEETDKLYSVDQFLVSSEDVSLTYNGEYAGDKEVKQAGGFYVLDEAPLSSDFTINNIEEGKVVINGNSLSVCEGYDAAQIYTLRCMKGNSYARYHGSSQLSAEDATNMLTYEDNNLHFESLFYIEEGAGDYAGYYTIRSVVAPTMYAYNLNTANEDSKVAMKEAPVEGDLTGAYYWKISSFGKETPANITPWGEGGDAYGWNKRGSYNGYSHIGYWQGGNVYEDNKWYVNIVKDELVEKFIPLHTVANSVVGYATYEDVAAVLPYTEVITAEGLNMLKNAQFKVVAPQVGKYYRLKNEVSGLYMSGDEEHITLVDKEHVASTIFYLDENYALKAHNTGRYLDCSKKDYADGENKPAGTFGFAYGGMIPNVITYKNNENWTFGANNKGDNLLDKGSDNPNQAGYNWILEEGDVDVWEAKAQLATLIDELYNPWALSFPLQVDDATAGYYLSSCGSADGNVEANMIDGKNDTFYGSPWLSTVNGVDYHYWQVDLGEGVTLKDFVFSYTTRANGSDMPTEIVVKGSVDGVTFSEITTISEGLPNAASAVYTSEAIAPTAKDFRYVRFEVTGTNNNFAAGGHATQKTFAIAEFVMWHHTKPIMDAAQAVVDDKAATLDEVNLAYQNLKMMNVEKPVYPFTVTTDDEKPMLYVIKSGRANDGKEWWYSYDATDGKIALAQYTGADNQFWFFKEVVTEDYQYALQLYPYVDKTKAMSYENTDNGTAKIVAKTPGTEGWINLWLLASTEGNAPYGLQTYDKNNYLSNNTGVNHKMGMWNAAPKDDTGTAMYISTPAEVLRNLIDAAKVKAVPGHDGEVGYYSAETAEALRSAITLAETNLANKSYSVSELNDAIANLSLILPEAGKYYQIKSAKPEFYENHHKEMAIYSNATSGKLSWKALDATDKSFYWSITPNNEGESFVIQNVGDEKYVPAVAADRYTMTSEVTSAQGFTLKLLTPGQFNIIGGGTMHMMGHGEGANSSGEICSYGGAANSPSAWTIVEVEHPDLAIAKINLQARIDELNPMTEYAGTDPGYYKVEEIAKLATALAAVEAVMKSGNSEPTTYTEALATLNNVVEGLELEIIPVTAGLYRIVSASTVFAEEKSITLYAQDGHYQNRTNPGWSTTNLNDPKQYWTLEDAGDGTFYLKGVDGNYITSATSMTDTPKAATFTALGATQFNITLSGDEKPLHTNGWNWNNTTEASLTTWDGGIGSCSAWKLVAVTEKPTFTHDLTVGSVGYATLMLGFNAEIPDGVTCYSVTVNAVENVAGMTAITGNVLPANTPVIVEAAEGTYTFTSADKVGTTPKANELKGTLYPKFITPETANTTCYVLANGTDGVGLYKAALNKNENTAFLNNANKVYLPVTVAESKAPRALTFRFGGTTSIEDAELTIDNSQLIIYDLTGRRINEIVEKGIYIVNGKKVVIK